MSADGFSPVAPDNNPGSGPTTNRGQKYPDFDQHGALIDYLTVVIPKDRLVSREGCAVWNVHTILPFLLGTREELSVTPIQEKAFQFYKKSSTIFDHNGEVCGKIGFEGNGDTVCVSLTGVGCRWVKNWSYVAHQLEVCQGHISRVDLAYDDYDGALIDLHGMREQAKSGEGFCNGGRPPKSSFLDDHGSGLGCTLYVGQKGHKQLCVYEKGKQQGDETSPWLRIEARMYAKHAEVVLDVLRKPLEFLRGSYPILARLLPGVCSRLETVVRTIDVRATAMVRWLKNQCGGSINLLMQAVGKDNFAEWVSANVSREKQPSRFARCGAAPGDLPVLLRTQLCLA